MGGLRDAAWLYPDPVAGRENIRNHVTFAVNKGVAITAQALKSEGIAAVAGTSGEAVTNEGASRRAALPATRPRALTAPLRTEAAAPLIDPTGLAFGETATRFLSVGDKPGLLWCHTNCSQAAQGTAFLTPSIRRGQTLTLHIHCINKPGRMRYFIGCAPAPFAVDAGQALIQRSSYSLENLKAAPHRPGKPCDTSAPPCFHTGSTVVMHVDLTSSPGTIAWEMDATHHMVTLADEPELHAFISLYNRDAHFRVQLGRS